MARRFARKGSMRRAHRRAQGYILGTIRRKGGSPRFLRREFDITVPFAAEGQTQLLTGAADAPTDMVTPESGARLEYLNFKGTCKDLNAGVKLKYIIYIVDGGVAPSSSTPYADYWDTTEPPTKLNNEIRRAKLIVGNVTLPVNATFPAKVTFKRKFRRPITFNQGTVIKISLLSDDTANRTMHCNVVAVFRK